MTQVKQRYLLLENGTVFEGHALGANALQSIGEVVFTTNMTGFTETVTNPAYCGQIVVQTFPLIGNYGINSADLESKPALTGYIVSQLCQTPSHFACMGTFDTFLMEHNVPGIFGVDTRSLTKMIRNNVGALRGIITDNPASVNIATLKNYEIGDAVSRVTVKEPDEFPAKNAKFNVAMWDFGYKASDIRALNARGCNVTVYPANTTAEQIPVQKYDGIFLTGGPGNPATYQNIADEIAKFVGHPIFGYGLGHQLLAMAMGGTTERLPYGHRGGYSVYDNNVCRTEIVDQNHGYVISLNKLPAGASVSFSNVNDKSCEGLDYDFGFSVQFEPTAVEFDRFIRIMGGK